MIQSPVNMKQWPVAMFFVDSLSKIAAFRLGKFNFAKSFFGPQKFVAHFFEKKTNY